MAEPGDKSDYEALVEEFRNIAGPLDFLVDAVQDGIELEEFALTKHGKVIIERAARCARAAIEIILDPTTSSDDLAKAVMELRVQHRVLESFGDPIATGRGNARTIIAGDHLDPTDTVEDTDL